MSITSINMASVIMDVNTYVCDKDDATLFQIIDEWQFFEYPHCTGVGYSNFNLLPMDTVVAKGQFHVKQGTALEQIILNSISVSLVAVKQNDVEEFNLESFPINTSGFLPNCDNIQEIDFSQDRDFLQPEGDCRNEIRLFRMPTLDIAGYSAYELIYPFKVRWEEWRELQGANRCFPTPTQNWMVYANQTGWSIKFAINASVEQLRVGEIKTANLRSIITDFEHIVWGTIQDPCEKPYAVEFNTLHTGGVISYEELIGKDVNTKVEATITGDFSGYTADQLYGILSLDAWGVGGVAYVHEIGTRIPVDEDGVWYGEGSSLVATLTKVNNSTMKLSAYLNYLYLPTDTNQFILSAKVREFHQSASSSGADCLNEIQHTIFTCGELQIIEVIDANSFKVAGEVVTTEERSVFLDAVTFTFVTATTWRMSGGTIDGNPIASGTTGGNIVRAPAHPYTDAIVGDTIQGDVTGSTYSSTITVDGIGDMQIGCTFFVS